MTAATGAERVAAYDQRQRERGLSRVTVSAYVDKGSEQAARDAARKVLTTFATTGEDYSKKVVDAAANSD